MAQAFIAALLSIGLLASGDACAWLCGTDDASTAVETQTHADLSSHCGGGASSEPVPDEPPSHEDCPGCALDVGANSLVLDTAGSASLFAARALPVAVQILPDPVTLAGLAPPSLDRAPPRDVLSLSTTLLL